MHPWEEHRASPLRREARRVWATVTVTALLCGATPRLSPQATSSCAGRTAPPPSWPLQREAFALLFILEKECGAKAEPRGGKHFH